MKEITTCGDMCLDDEYGITYKVAAINYTEREDGDFMYEIKPNYSVISLLGPENFQGIPGLDLELGKESYIRENITPVFISERTPGENRENLWDLLKAVDMDYLNRLEWLIRTDTRYSGDKLYVQRPENRSIKVENITVLGNRSSVICRKLLDTICYGDRIETPYLVIDDSNRKQYYELIKALYSTERKFLDEKRREGITRSAKAGKYKGRERIRINSLEAEGVFSDYAARRISSTTAAKTLGISKSTFLRRYREHMCRLGTGPNCTVQKRDRLKL